MGVWLAVCCMFVGIMTLVVVNKQLQARRWKWPTNYFRVINNKNNQTNTNGSEKLYSYYKRAYNLITVDLIYALHFMKSY